MSIYPKQITDSFSDCLNQCIVTYDVEDRSVVTALSSLVDIVAASIEMQLIVGLHKIPTLLPEDFGVEYFDGASLRYMYYPEYIIEGVRHGIRAFKFAYKQQFEYSLIEKDCIWIEDNIIEELADQVAYHIDILTIKNCK
ncbi:hypothetical protein OTK49_00410 [Vibrio coralliirubri]|uniref:hypothetical protein n=1 Tax=Vibrio coralliirubri TaxID=1516159 RepID=UPI002284D9E4|nr:hypothetical protein [Vibrio coralliirubri]MCY9861003.1 hypothetical protein [Vibrio coralliirubri]